MADNLVSQSELMKALDALAIAQLEVDNLPPYLRDDELTVDRFYEKNKDKISKVDARNILERLAAPDGPLEKQNRRTKGKSGGRCIVYVVKE